MPRKPRVDPPALESFEIEVNGEKIECEIRDETCVIKSPGYANRELCSDRLWNSIMPKVVADYLDVNGRKNPSLLDLCVHHTSSLNRSTALVRPILRRSASLMLVASNHSQAWSTFSKGQSVENKMRSAPISSIASIRV